MQERLFTMARLEDFVPAVHPLRPIQQMVNEALKRLNRLFNEMYAAQGRASIAPEKSSASGPNDFPAYCRLSFRKLGPCPASNQPPQHHLVAR
jgi:hypothetical protein